jgi:hypothetical protein
MHLASDAGDDLERRIAPDLDLGRHARTEAERDEQREVGGERRDHGPAHDPDLFARTRRAGYLAESSTQNTRLATAESSAQRSGFRDER